MVTQHFPPHLTRKAKNFFQLLGVYVSWNGIIMSAYVDFRKYLEPTETYNVPLYHTFHGNKYYHTSNLIVFGWGVFEPNPRITADGAAFCH